MTRNLPGGGNFFFVNVVELCGLRQVSVIFNQQFFLNKYLIFEFRVYVKQR